MNLPYVRVRNTISTAQRSSRMRALIEAIKASPMTAAQMGDLLQMSQSGARKYLREMMAGDVIHEVGRVQARLPTFAGYPVFAITGALQVAAFEKTLSAPRDETAIKAAVRRGKLLVLPPGVSIHVMGDDSGNSPRRSTFVPKRGEMETYLFGPAPASKVDE